MCHECPQGMVKKGNMMDGMMQRKLSLAASLKGAKGSKQANIALRFQMLFWLGVDEGPS